MSLFFYISIISIVIQLVKILGLSADNDRKTKISINLSNRYWRSHFSYDNIRYFRNYPLPTYPIHF
jgi:hypothetical protein